MKSGRYISLWLKETASVMRNEFRSIFTDEGVMLVLVFAIFIYSTIYGLAYGNQVLRNVPVGVIDNSKSPASRALTQSFDAGPNTYVAYEPADMEEAKKLFFDREIYGIVYIPKDYERKLLAGEQANVSIYCDASYFLMYRQVFQEIVSTLGYAGAKVEMQRLLAQGVNLPQAEAVTQPVIYQSHNLFNPYLGYGTFVMPAIIILIIQQTLLIGIGMIGGTWHEFDLYSKFAPRGEERMFALPVLLGKAFTYIIVSGVIASYILTIHYHLYGYPMNGEPLTVIALVLPYILACIMLGIGLSTLFTRRENSILWLLWSSLPVLLLSGVSYPSEAMPEWMVALGKVLPSSHAVRAFIRVQDMGASFEDVLPEIRSLWRLTVIYGGLAYIAMHLTLSGRLRRRRRSMYSAR